MKRLLVVGLGVLSIGLTGVAHAQQMRVPYNHVLTLDMAKKCVAAAEAESRKNNWNMAIAVVNAGGYLIAFEAMDNVQIGSVQVAIDKATTANNFRRPTKAFEDVVAGGRNAILALRGATPLEGGVPLVLDGKIIGAIGVSGELSGQDAQAAKACADNLGK
jgi:glc operon protein GlcG